MTYVVWCCTQDIADVVNTFELSCSIGKVALCRWRSAVIRGKTHAIRFEGVVGSAQSEEEEEEVC